VTEVSPNVTSLTRTIKGLDFGQVYAFVTMPVRDGFVNEVSPWVLSYFNSVDYSVSADPSQPAPAVLKQMTANEVFVDFRMGFKVCKWTPQGCAP